MTTCNNLTDLILSASSSNRTRLDCLIELIRRACIELLFLTENGTQNTASVLTAIEQWYGELQYIHSVLCKPTTQYFLLRYSPSQGPVDDWVFYQRLCCILLYHLSDIQSFQIRGNLILMALNHLFYTGTNCSTLTGILFACFRPELLRNVIPTVTFTTYHCENIGYRYEAIPDWAKTAFIYSSQRTYCNMRALPFVGISDDQYNILEEEYYRRLLSHMTDLDTQIPLADLLEAIRTCVGIIGQVMGRWDQYNIGVPSHICSYADLTELYFELDYLKYRLEDLQNDPEASKPHFSYEIWTRLCRANWLPIANENGFCITRRFYKIREIIYWWGNRTKKAHYGSAVQVMRSARYLIMFRQASIYSMHLKFYGIAPRSKHYHKILELSEIINWTDFTPDSFNSETAQKIRARTSQ